MKNYRLFKTILFITILLPTIAFSQRPALKIDENFPKGKEGEVLKQFIQIINNEKNKTVFLSMHSSEENRDALSQQLDELKEETGGLIFKGIFKSRRAKEDQTILVAEDIHYGLWKGVFIKFNNKEDYKIEGIRFRMFPKPISEEKISEGKIIKTLCKTVKKLDKKDLFSGTILIAKGNKILYKKATGEASKRYDVANNLDTKFNLASVGKMFTAVSIMQLKEQNKLKLNDTISKYIGSTWLPKEISNKITIHHLLTHTSGLGSYFNDKFENGSKQNYRNTIDFKPLVANDSLRFEPGKGFHYSNTAVLLLGVIIENISGTDYETYINNHIYKPSNMINSGFYEIDQPVENLAIGYSKAKNKYGWENNFFKHVIKGGPAGGSYSTVTDLHNFILALKNGKLVSKESLNQIWTKHTRYSYGYCFGVETTEKGGKQVGHNGGAPGVSAEVIYDIKKDIISVVLSNYENGDQVSFMIRDLIHQIVD